MVELPNLKEMSSNVEEYFSKQEGNKDLLVGKEIFNNKKVEVKTDINIKEVVIINSLMWNNDYLESHGLTRLYDDYINNYMTLKISLDRKSRGEFVDVHKKSTDSLVKDANLQDIKKVKQ